MDRSPRGAHEPSIDERAAGEACGVVLSSFVEAGQRYSREHDGKGIDDRNYRVDDVDAIVARLHEEGAETSMVTVRRDAEGQGKFVRLLDPEGHRIELWQHLADGS